MLGSRLISRVVVLALVGGGLVGLAAAEPAHAAGTPELSVADLSAVEGNFGTASIRVPVTLSQPAATKVKVPYTVAAARDGVTDPNDVQLLKGTLTFAPGAVSKFVTVTSVGDTVVEQDQHATVTLGTPIGGPVTVTKGVGEVTLTDDDASGLPPATLTVSIGEVSMQEGNEKSRIGYIPVLLSAPATVVTKVGFTIDCNTASLLTDIKIAKKGTIVFQPGQRSKYIAFTIYPDKTIDEAKAITESIVAQANTAKVLDNRGDAEINDDDGKLPPRGGYPVANFQAESLPSASSFNAQSIGDHEMLDVTPSGSAGATPTIPGAPSLSYDGRYAAFVSPQGNLVPGDTNGKYDVFVRDRQTGTTERVSGHYDGTQISSTEDPGFSWPTLSADGRFVLYSTNLALDPADANPYADAYLYDRVAHTTELITKDTSGFGFGKGTMYGSALSAHGRYVLFAGPTSTQGYGVFVRDRVAGTTTKIYDNPRSNTDNELSANGRYAVIPTEQQGCLTPSLVLIDLLDGSAERVDVNDDGDAADNGWSSWFWMFKPSISGDGRYVAFNTDAWNLMPNLAQQPWHSGAYDSNNLHVYVRDLVDKSTTMMGLGAGGAVPPPVKMPGQTAMSLDGNIVVSEQGQNAASIAWDRAAGSSRTFGQVALDYPTSYVEAEFPYVATALSGDGRYIGYYTGYHTDPSHADWSYTQHVWAERIG